MTRAVADRVRQRPIVSSTMPRAAGARRSIPRSEAAALDFLADVLVGDTDWRLVEVQNLLALHTLAGLGHWHASGLDDTHGETV